MRQSGQHRPPIALARCGRAVLEGIWEREEGAGHSMTMHAFWRDAWYPTRYLWRKVRLLHAASAMQGTGLAGFIVRRCLRRVRDGWLTLLVPWRQATRI